MSDDPRLSSLIKEGTEGDIVLVGYPFEHASIRMRKKGGQENGPCCLRRFFGKVGPLFNAQYQIDISRVNLTDYGNIHGDPKNSKQLQASLKTVLDDLVKAGKIPVTIGGSRQTTLVSSLSFLQRFPSGKLIYFCGYPSVSRPYDHDRLASNSLFRILPQRFQQQCLLVGTSDKYWPSFTNVDLKRIDLSQIRKTKTELHPDILTPRTQAGTVIRNLLRDQKSQDLYVSFSLEVIHQFMGTYYKPTQGLQVQQLLQVMLELGRDSRVRCLDITEFNPANQDYNSSLTILNMIYYFLMGFTLRGT